MRSIILRPLPAARMTPTNPLTSRKLDLTGLGAAVGFIASGLLTYAFPWYAGLEGWPATAFHGVAYGVLVMGALAAIGGLEGVTSKQVRDALWAVVGLAVLGAVMYGLHRLAASLDGWARLGTLLAVLAIANLAVLVLCISGAEAVEQAIERGAPKREKESTPKRFAGWAVAALGLLTPVVEFLPKAVDAARAVLGG